MKIVADTNVLIAGTFWKGPPHDIVLLAEEGNVSLCATAETIAEFYGVLQREKFKPYLTEAGVTADAILARLSRVMILVAPKEKIVIITVDPSDNMFLSCALAAQARCIVSGDEHLLKLKKFQDIPIFTSHQFLTFYQRAKTH